jgi:hypothetical protein
MKMPCGQPNLDFCLVCFILLLATSSSVSSVPLSILWLRSHQQDHGRDYGRGAASLEFGKVLLELKQIASSIRHAPEELLEVLEELDVTDNILQMLAHQDALLLAIYAPPAVIQKCRDSCKNCVDIVRPVCLELQKTIERSKLRGSLKSVLKKNILKRPEGALRVRKGICSYTDSSIEVSAGKIKAIKLPAYIALVR